ncbi:MAG: DUF4143 domain-containing protein [Gracilibacteraceae bacterium]|nr:DUF4143 domain-containing protein [Gracilibacteraceae bacterium]
MSSGHKAAYARFNYRKSGMREVNAEILRLAREGFTDFFIDEAPYLGGFLTDSAEWADTFVPVNRIKIVVSGTDSFELWLAMNRALYHRYVRFSTNRNSYPEFKRVLGQSYEEYKSAGGVFLSGEETGPEQLEPGSAERRGAVVEHFIQAAVVENLIHTLEHCNEDYDGKNYYFDRLYAIDQLVIFKGVISILESAAAGPIRKNFIKDAEQKNIPALGTAVSKWPDPEKRDIKERIADSLSVYQEFRKIEEPGGTIDALIEFLIKIGCLAESSSGVSDLVDRRRTLYFAHNALMNYAIQETIRGILTLTGIKGTEFVDALKQAAEGSINENIVYFHLLLSVRGDEKLFRYRDPEDREIDAVIIDREAKSLRLIEIKSKAKIDAGSVFRHEAKHLFEAAVLKNIGADSSFTVTRVVAYSGQNSFAVNKEHSLLLVNIEDLLQHYKVLGPYLDQMLGQAEEFRKKKFPLAMVEEIRESAVRIHSEYVLPEKTKGKGEPGIGE